MQEQFVPYEIALKLQEKGFDWPCLAVHHKGEFQIPRGFGMAIVTKDQVNVLKGNAVLTPLWQQVIDWLDINHNLEITIKRSSDKRYWWHITKLNTEDKIKGYSGFSDTKIAALSKVIQTALELI